MAPPRRDPHPAPAGPAPATLKPGEVAAGWARPGAGQQLLLYAPEGPLGGTFTCVHCHAQAWQPDLLAHVRGCPAVADRP